MEESDDDELDWDPDRERLRRRVQAHLRVMGGDDDGYRPQRRSIADRRAVWQRAREAALERSISSILANDAAGDAGSAPPSARSSASAWGGGLSDDDADVWSVGSIDASDDDACDAPALSDELSRAALGAGPSETASKIVDVHVDAASAPAGAGAVVGTPPAPGPAAAHASCSAHDRSAAPSRSQRPRSSSRTRSLMPSWLRTAPADELAS